MTEVVDDRSHDSLDPTTGVLTTEAQAKRQALREWLTEPGKVILSWFETVNHPKFQDAIAAVNAGGETDVDEDASMAEPVEEPAADPDKPA